MVVKDVSSSQINSIGSVQISATVCVSGTAGTCPEQGNTTVNAGNNNQNVQLFVAYRVTTGTTPPASLRFTGDGGGGPLFTPNASYTAELERLAPAGAGLQWFGYTSTLFNYVAGSSPTTPRSIGSVSDLVRRGGTRRHHGFSRHPRARSVTAAAPRAIATTAATGSETARVVSWTPTSPERVASTR